MEGEGNWRVGGGCADGGMRITSSSTEDSEDVGEGGLAGAEEVDSREPLMDFRSLYVLMVSILDSAILAARRCGTTGNDTSAGFVIPRLYPMVLKTCAVVKKGIA